MFRSFLKGQKGLKSEFSVEVIIFVKSIKKASSGIFTLGYMKASNTVCYNFTTQSI